MYITNSLIPTRNMFMLYTEKKYIYPRVIRGYNESSFNTPELDHASGDGQSSYQPSTISTSNDVLDGTNESPNNFEMKTAFHANRLATSSYLSESARTGSRLRKNSSIYDYGHSISMSPGTSRLSRHGLLSDQSSSL